jgi:plastocyanin
MRFRRVLVAGALLGSAAFAPGASHAAGGPILAGPGSSLTTYATPVVVWTPGTPLTFVNADIDAHDVVSDETRAPGTASYCPAGGPRCPLFRTDQIGIGQTDDVDGLHDVPAGVYLFHCSPHPWMEARLVVV